MTNQPLDAESKSLDTPIFLIGYARSGTTLIKAILNSHPEIHLAHEPEILKGLSNMGIAPGQLINRQIRADLFAETHIKKPFRRFLETISEIRRQEIIADENLSSVAALYRALVRNQHSSGYWGDKSLTNHRYLDELIQLFPQAKVLVIVRDPRETVYSVVNKRSKAEPTSELISNQYNKFAMKWNDWANNMLDKVERFQPGQALVIRFEDLVSAPKETVGKVMDWLGLDHDFDQMERARQSAVLEGREAESHHKNLSKPLLSEKKDRKEELPERDRYRIARNAKSGMARLGYDISGAKFSLRHEVAFRLAEIKLLLQGKRKKLKAEWYSSPLPRP